MENQGSLLDDLHNFCRGRLYRTEIFPIKGVVLLFPQLLEKTSYWVNFPCLSLSSGEVNNLSCPSLFSEIGYDDLTQDEAHTLALYERDNGISFTPRIPRRIPGRSLDKVLEKAFPNLDQDEVSGINEDLGSLPPGPLSI